MDFLSASSKEPNGISPGPSSDLASSPHLLLRNKGQHSDWPENLISTSPLQTKPASSFVSIKTGAKNGKQTQIVKPKIALFSLFCLTNNSNFYTSTHFLQA